MKHVRDYSARPNKKQARDWMFLDIPPRTSILTLPSQQIACVEEMQRRQIIGKHTQQQWVERNQRIGKLLAMRLHDHTHLHRGWLEDYEPIAMIDLANLDMESSFTERLGLWIEDKLAPKLLPDSYVILTVMGFGRNNNFMEQWLPQQITNGLFRDELHEMKLLSGCLNEDILLPGVLLRSALHRFDARRIRSAGYRDREGSDMLAVCFHVVGPAQTNVRPFSEIVAQYRKTPIVIDRSRRGPTQAILDRVIRTLAAMNFSISAAEDGKWWIHNHDRQMTTLPIPLSLDDIIQFFQITPQVIQQMAEQENAAAPMSQPILPPAASPPAPSPRQPNPVMQEAGRKAWLTRRLRAAGG